MWSWISCYLMGHDYGVCCETGAIYLRCQTCGRRSNGWDLHRETVEGIQTQGEPHRHAPVLASARHQ